MKVLAVALILPTATVLAIAAFGTQIFDPSPPSNVRVKGIVWRGNTFASRADFARWLRSRGIRYRVWARRHPSVVGVAANPKAHAPAQQRAEARRAPQNGSDWKLKGLGGAAVLASLSVGIVFVRRRPDGTGELATTIQRAARRAVLATREGVRWTLRRAAKATTLLSSRLAASWANTTRRRRGELAWYLATGLLAAGLGLAVTAWLNGV